MFERTQNTAFSAAFFVRLGLILTFFFLAIRLYHLQIVEGNDYRSVADRNRFRLIEISPPRGVIYDRNGVILARNRPSFRISVVPADLPVDDPGTAIDERAQALVQLLQLLEADTDPEIAQRLAQVMFRRLGRADFARAVEGAGVPLKFEQVPLEAAGIEAEDLEEATEFIEVPDLSDPLPLPGLLALVLRVVELGSQGSSYRPIPILELVERERAFDVAERSFQFSGIHVDQVPVRQYVDHDLVSHALGFMGPIPAARADAYAANGYADPGEQVGLSGIEYAYQEELRGKPGYKFIEVDILGREARTVGQVVDPVPGQNLRLTIDRQLQQVMYDALTRQMEEVDAPHAVAIAMNPQSGEVLGMVSLPSFDNNIFSEGIGPEYEALAQDERKPLINYAIGGLYPPGSTFKLVTATAGLAEGVISPETVVVDSGPIYLANRFFPNDLSQAQRFVSWNHKLGITHGRLTVRSAIALSNDIFFYWLGGGYPNAMTGLGDERMAHWTRLFGFGDLTGIDLPGEVAAAVPDDQWKRLNKAERWTTGDSYNMAIGQGYVLSTPLQVLVSAVAVANGGTVYRPQMVHQIVDAEGGLQRDYVPDVIRELPVDRALLEVVRQGMYDVVEASHGTATRARVEGIEVAGKTGTAEFCEWLEEEQDCRRIEGDHLPFHAWFVAFAPYDNPEIAVVVFVYDGGEGSTVAVPVAQEILQAYFTEIRPQS